MKFIHPAIIEEEEKRRREKHPVVIPLQLPIDNPDFYRRHPEDTPEVEETIVNPERVDYLI